MSPYSITREDAGKDYAAVSHAVHIITNYGGASPQTRERLEDLVAALEAQLPAPIPEEPTGDVLVRAFNLTYKRQDGGDWWPVDNVASGYEWADMWAECRRTNRADPVIYDRRVDATPPRGEAAEGGRWAEDIHGPHWVPSPPATPPTEAGWLARNAMPAGSSVEVELDPLEALYAHLFSYWELDDSDKTILRDFVTKVRELAQADTVPAAKVRELVAFYAQKAKDYSDTNPYARTLREVNDSYAALLPKEPTS